MSEPKKPTIIKCPPAVADAEPEHGLYGEFAPDSPFWNVELQEEARDLFVFGYIDKQENGRRRFPNSGVLASMLGIDQHVVFTWGQAGSWLKLKKEYEEKRLKVKDRATRRTAKDIEQGFVRRKKKVSKKFEDDLDAGKVKVSAASALGWEAEEHRRYERAQGKGGGRGTRYEEVLKIILKRTEYDESEDWKELEERADAEYSRESRELRPADDERA